MMQSPLPVRDGVNATRLRLPDEGPWDTAMDYMMHRWGHIDPQGIEDRFDAGEIVGEGGVPLTRHTRLEDHTFIWYYRTLPPETRLPVEIGILYRDEHLLVVDKPHFLPTTPGGTYIQESALVRLRNQLELPDLIPMHRLDRMTAGVLLFSTNPQTRGKYQVLFEKRQVQKEYECVSAAEPSPGHPAVDFPVVVRNRMTKSRSYLLAEVIDGEPNAETRIERLETFDGGPAAGADGAGQRLARYRLEPHTGKTHQLRVHMASLGLGIVNDAFYPDLLDKAPDDYSRPLQLLARGIRFVDPVSGKPVEYRSSLELSEAVRARA
ncbi:tRNA pseudouridine32 synthase/23S rRNA pseudouridine746 synthase [Pseudarthrobacter niigatensis]|uniref:RNA pseudouridylate synthase n=2 Tax=Pseudarthrobacter niigatensis TaxID=369935 RepID=A0AAJ1ST02_9MICC|nr:tRNA pseudouridine32 synthase/23S rRNA pseudouridine746 synthase [Pseudarthrobacter niigatensis]MDQ0266825.1 tRNA pseudouridine32 synthase/23S rRNA pseudouridine746 synthase [Pseudarthrobacter niigatensis]